MNRTDYILIILLLGFQLALSQAGVPLDSLLSPQEARERIRSNSAILIDVSSHEFYLNKHAEGAQSFCLARMPEFEKK
ncbi:MAG TPA: hypothetical protein VII11_02430, partial [Bacteroidota bacterium]